MYESWNDVSCYFGDWCLLLEQLGGGSLNMDDEVWESAKCYGECPHFGNIRQDVLLSRVGYEISERWPNAEVSYFINALDVRSVSERATADVPVHGMSFPAFQSRFPVVAFAPVRE